MRFSQVETYWVYPVFSPARPAPRNLSIRLYKRTRVTRMQNTAPWPLERFSCARKGQCKCCAENYGTRSRWPGSNRHRPQFCFRAALPLSYSGICAAGRKRQSPAAIGMEVCGHERTRKPIIILVASPFGAIWHHFCLKSVLRLRFMYFSPDYWLDQPYNQEIHQNDRLY